MATDFTSNIVGEDDTYKLLTHFVKTSHRIKNPDIRGETVMELCSLLFGKDYKFLTVPNMQGELCGHYPMKLIILEYEREAPADDEAVETQYDPCQLEQMIKFARCSRCRARFVMPVILYEGKHVCRSATLSGAAEMFGRSTKDYILSRQAAMDMGRSDMFSTFRGHDIDLLKFFDINYICDLMVEKKKTKFKMAITSSEKVDKENRYSDFTILRMPYPGCELFKDWKANMYNGHVTVYDWGLAMNDSDLDLPKSPIVDDMQVDWHTYREWSLTELTQNYLKLLLQYLKHGSSGVLIHCISGWDRTPLFISLLRLSLWADGVIHKSLSASEILYLTLGYDWYLFGHDLPNRLHNDQEIMHFCFKVLQDISSDEFSISPSPSSPSSPLPRLHSPQHSEGRTGCRHHSLTNTGQGSGSGNPRLQGVSNHMRVNSDCSLGVQEGVLLSDDLMNFPPVGSTTSLTSHSSSGCGSGPGDISGAIQFEAGSEIDQSAGNQHFVKKDGLRGLAGSSQTRASPPSHMGSWVDTNPLQDTLQPEDGIQPKIIESSTDAEVEQLAFLKSNHFAASKDPVIHKSSPVFVPRRKALETVGSLNSLGSWQVIDSGEHLRSIEATNPQNSQPDITSIGSCNIALAINMSTLRCQRLDAVSRLFHEAYYAALSDEMGEGWQELGGSGGGGTLSSIFNSLVGQVGFKSSTRGGKQDKERYGTAKARESLRIVRIHNKRYRCTSWRRNIGKRRRRRSIGRVARGDTGKIIMKQK
ncbi:hypothetical protein RRG08_003172 [Elysia crispata]|uniref:Tyrosine specific protein phosphatases domain-containing protein n=1 Tax=Elysia crispata TaxID=231223 RepID=A0AAE1B708_9GAST|nr:hypothetical protein RRG08_003172 [Elysia crispata]